MKRAILTAALLLALPFSVHGVIGVDSDRNTTGAVVYAKETLSKSDTIEKDGVTYYVVSESNRIVETTGNVRLLELDIYLPFPYAGSTNSNMAVTVALDGMVLGRNLDLTNSPNTTVRGQFELRYGNQYSTKRPGLTYHLFSGGQREDSEFTVRISTGSAQIHLTDSLYVSLGRLGILPDTPGTIRVTFLAEIENAIGETIRDTTTYVMRDAVKAMNLLDVTATANNATVDLASGGLTLFKAGDNTGSEGKAANVGKVAANASMTFTAGDPYYRPFIHPGGERVLAANGTLIVDPSHTFRTTSPYYTGPGGSTYTDSVSPPSGTLASVLGSAASIEIEGETEFLGEDGKLFVSPNANCEPSRDSLIDADEEAISAPLSAFAGDGAMVCLEVDGETPITDTTPFAATLKHTSTTAAFPIPEATYELGAVEYGGAVAEIPVLTTDERYNNRIMLWNRGTRPAPYTITFTTSEGVTATPKEAATGELPVGRTVLHVRDIVTINDGSDDESSDGGFATGTVMVQAIPSAIEVSSRITNRTDGSTDTVVYDVR